MDLFIRSGQDPFVMMAWRCKNLEEIVIHGYVIDPHNIVGMSRLRGQSLKRLEISMIDETPTEASMDSFIDVNTYFHFISCALYISIVIQRKSTFCLATNGNPYPQISYIQHLVICQ